MPSSLRQFGGALSTERDLRPFWVGKRIKPSSSNRGITMLTPRLGLKVLVAVVLTTATLGAFAQPVRHRHHHHHHHHPIHHVYHR